MKHDNISRLMRFDQEVNFQTNKLCIWVRHVFSRKTEFLTVGALDDAEPDVLSKHRDITLHYTLHQMRPTDTGVGLFND